MKDIFVGGDELSLSVTYRQIHFRQTFRPHTGRRRIEPHPHPSVLEYTGIIVDEGRFRFPTTGKIGKYTHFHKYLKAVADTDYQFPGIEKPGEMVPQVLLKESGEHLS